MYYLDDGCHDESDGSSDDIIGTFQLEDSTAAASCCSRDGRKCNTIGSCPQRSSHMTYHDAAFQCDKVGLRLCKKDELRSGICCNSKNASNICDNYSVWTSTKVQGKCSYVNFENMSLYRLLE